MATNLGNMVLERQNLMTNKHESIQIKVDSASVEELEKHLNSCKFDFVPPLHTKVEIKAYAKKLRDNAKTFEAWLDGNLVGVVAIYLNNHRSQIGFITSVSVFRSFNGKGIGITLVKQGISLAKSEDFKELRLEVSRANHKAIQLYLKLGFQKIDEDGDNILMKLVL